MNCKRCGSTSVSEELIIQSNGDFKIKGSCASCQCYIKWIPYSESKIIKQALTLFYKECGTLESKVL